MKNKAPLSWDLNDFLNNNEEPPECVILGTTEGEIMDIEGIKEWVRDVFRNLSVLKESYPESFEAQYELYKLDLDYLYGLGKIDRTMKDNLIKRENFNFG